MVGLTWLHLSDWHQGGKDFNREVVRDELIKDIENREKISSDLEEIDFIIFSGDVAYHAKTEQYNKAIEEFFEPLIKATGVERDRLFIVPGNHDLEWKALETLPDELQKPFTTPEIVNEWLTDERRRQILLKPMDNYCQFMTTYLGKDVAGAEPAFAYVRSFDIEDKKIALIGLNSAWMAARHKEIIEGKEEVRDYGHLALGEPQVRKALKDASDVDLKIAALHHPFDCLTTTDTLAEKSIMRGLLHRECHFILHGHEHEQSVAIPRGTIGECAILSAGQAMTVVSRRLFDMRMAIILFISILGLVREPYIYGVTWIHKAG